MVIGGISMVEIGRFGFSHSAYACVRELVRTRDMG